MLWSWSSSGELAPASQARTYPTVPLRSCPSTIQAALLVASRRLGRDVPLPVPGAIRAYCAITAVGALPEVVARRGRHQDVLRSRVGAFECILGCRLTSVAAGGGGGTRRGTRCARVHGAILSDPPQQNVIR